MYRFGHSMVRPSYRANLAGNPDGTAFFGFIFDPAGEGQADPVDLRGGRRARRRFIGWQTFFNFGDGQVRPNKRIDRTLTLPELAGYGLGLDRSTPLWYYILAEAELIGDGIVLGPTGARLITEVFVGLLQLDPRSYLRAAPPNWRPTLPSTTPSDFAMTDLLRWARVDPASRGQ